MGRRNKVVILAIGDPQDYDSFQKVERNRREFKRRGFRYISTQYRKILKNKFPPIKEDKIIVLLFFPFQYWNKHIEHKHYKGLYGNQTFYNKFIDFWRRTERIIKNAYKDKKLFFINEPQLCGAYRDKMNVIKRLNKGKVSLPDSSQLSLQKMKNRINRGNVFYLKPRYGSMGKGITYISRTDWQTNFIPRGNRIISRKSDRGWKFRDVKGNDNFIKKLLKKDIIMQKGVGHYLRKGSIIDLRIYTFLNEPLYVYPRKNKSDRVTTNISQGGRGSPRLLNKLPRHLINKAKKEAVKASKSLNIRFAGIDVIPNQKTNKAYIIDVNLFSGLPKEKTFNLTRHLADRIRRSVKNGNIPF